MQFPKTEAMKEYEARKAKERKAKHAQVWLSMFNAALTGILADPNIDWPEGTQVPADFAAANADQGLELYRARWEKKAAEEEPEEA